MQTIELNIKNPSLFAVSNHYEAKTPHIQYIIDTLTPTGDVFETCCDTDGDSWDYWHCLSDLTIEITPFGIDWKWISKEEGYDDEKRRCGLEYIATSIEGIQINDDDNLSFMEDYMMLFIEKDAKGLQTATEISNM